jgi:hypothetical protein
MRPEVNSQCRLLFGGLFHPQGSLRNPCCWRRGLISQLGSPCHGNGHCCDGGWAHFHLFGFGPGWQSRKTTSGYCQYTILLLLGNSSKQQISTWRTRFLAPCVCAPVDGPLAPVAARRSIPRFARRSCHDAPLLRLPPMPESSRLRQTRCCVELQQCELSWPERRHWGGGGLVGGCPVAAGSYGTAPCVPAGGSSVK